MKRFLLDPWFIFAMSLTLIASYIAYRNIHTGEPLERLSAWNWAIVGFMAALVIGGRAYQHFKQHR